jgi:hypothetical protein
MRKEVQGAIVAILMAISLGVGFLAGGGGRASTTSVSTATLISVSTVTEANSTVTLGPPYPAASLETANVTVGSQLRAIGVDENLHRIYVGDTSDDNLTVVDGYSHAVVAAIPLPAIASEIATDFQTHMVYADAGGVVVEINGTTDRVVGELPVKMGTISYDPTNKVVYGQANDSLVGLDARTGAVVANVSLGMFVNSVAVDTSTNIVVAAGCHTEGLVCVDTAFIVNGTSDSLVATVPLQGGDYPLVAASYRLFYVSYGALVALNETNGKVVFDVPQQECAPFYSIAFARNTDHLIATSINYNYTFVYDGRTGALLDMYSLPGAPQYVAENPLTNELYVTISSQLLAFYDSAGPGHVDIALVDSGGTCPLP